MTVTITSPPPADVVDELNLVRAALGHVIPAKSPGNLLVGTWNIRDFDRMTPAWRSAAGESPIRDLSNDRQDDPLYQAFTSTGLRPPGQLNFVPRTIFDDPDPQAPPNHRHFYDQIAWFSEAGATPALSMGFASAGMFNFDNGVIPAQSRQQLSWRISDHFLLWCEFEITLTAGDAGSLSTMPTYQSGTRLRRASVRQTPARVRRLPSIYEPPTN